MLEDGDRLTMDLRIPRTARAERHRLLGNPHRLAIVEALEEAPREIPELARLLGLHATTVRDHLEKLVEAGLVEVESGVPTGRGRPSKRYKLRYPLVGKDMELRLFIGSLVSLLRTAYGEGAVAAAEEEGARRGREFGRSLQHPSLEQVARAVSETLEQLSFAPAPPARCGSGLSVDVHHCPFNVNPDDPDGALVCAFHEGLVRGVAEKTSGEPVPVRLRPFIDPNRCRVELAGEATAAVAAKETRRSRKASGEARTSARGR
jgi:predicted ArsR family transcriptional regulator